MIWGEGSGCRAMIRPTTRQTTKRHQVSAVKERKPRVTSTSLSTLRSEYFVEWAPDGSEIVFSAYHGRHYEAIHAVDTSGTRLRELHGSGTFRGYEFGVHADLSPDGSVLAYTTCDYRAEDEAVAATEQISPVSPSPTPIESLYGSIPVPRRFYEIGTVKIDGTTPERLTTNRYNDFFPAWSPRGDAIAFLAEPRAPGFNRGYRGISHHVGGRRRWQEYGRNWGRRPPSASDGIFSSFCRHSPAMVT